MDAVDLISDIESNQFWTICGYHLDRWDENGWKVSKSLFETGDKSAEESHKSSRRTSYHSQGAIYMILDYPKGVTRL